MARQDQKKDKRREPGKRDDHVSANPEVIEKGKKIKENIDKLLDEIDDVLEENAEEFVKNYVQKGGQ
ncbi:MAG TPA: ubiquitin-like protein Pup [Nitrospiria bacterium]|jgi:ubiquitin-like protein Pup|nr:ubiquitin-like protein Pup [Nitrospiria bacterium]